MRKLKGYATEVIKDIIRKGESVFESETTLGEDVEQDPELKQKLLQAKKDILEGKVYSTEDILEMIQQGEL